MKHLRTQIIVLAALLAAPALASAQLSKTKQIEETVEYSDNGVQFPFVIYTPDGEFVYPNVTVLPRKAGEPRLVKFHYESDTEFYTAPFPYATINEAEALIEIDQRIVPVGLNDDCKNGMVVAKVQRIRPHYFAGGVMIEFAPGYAQVGPDGQHTIKESTTTYVADGAEQPFIVYPTGRPNDPVVSRLFVDDGAVTYGYRADHTFLYFPTPVVKSQWDSLYGEKEVGLER